jgi:hypothetical protein
MELDVERFASYITFLVVVAVVPYRVELPEYTVLSQLSRSSDYYVCPFYWLVS